VPIFKTLKLTEKHNLQLQFRAESFNAAKSSRVRKFRRELGNANFGKVTAIMGRYTFAPIQFVLKLCSDVWSITRDFYIRSSI